MSNAYLERIFPRKALLAVPTGERLDSKVYPLMPLQIVISIEALRALVTLEWAFIMWLLLLVAIQLLIEMCCDPTVIRHPTMEASARHTHHSHGIAWIMNI